MEKQSFTNDNTDRLNSQECNMLKNLSGPVSVAIDVTNKCNFKCLHCFNNSGNGKDDEFSDEELLQVADQIIDLNPHNVCICGGEPLCRKNLFDFIDKLKHKVGCISMVSNGYFMTEEVISKLKDSGIALIQISLDGVNDFEHDNFRGIKSSFDRAVKAIKMIEKAGISVATSFIPNKLNHKNISKYIDFCYSLNVTDVRMMPFIPMGRGLGFGNNLILNEIEYFEFQKTLYRKKREYTNKLNILWGDPLDHLQRLPNSANINANTYSMEIKSNGNLTVTTYLPIVVGNCRKHSLKEYWNAGYNTIWANEDVLSYTNTIKNIHDFEDFKPTPQSGEHIELNLI